MTSLILCNQLHRVKTYLKGKQDDLRYLSLVESQESRAICEYLNQKPYAEEVLKSHLFRQRRQTFRDKFVEFMGVLNQSNHSTDWWAMPFTNKNPDTTTLCRTISDFLSIIDLLRSDPRPLLVITDNVDLVIQIKSFLAKENLSAIFLMNHTGRVKKWLKLHTPIGTLLAGFKLTLIWGLSRRYRPARCDTESHVVIATISHLRSFTDSNRYRDVYFNKLVDYLAKTDTKVLVLTLMADHQRQQLRQIKSLRSEIPVIPMDACLTFGHLISCTMWALKSSLFPARPKGPFIIDGIDISCLINTTVRESQNSGTLFNNLRIFYCENRSWEKMLLLGLSHNSAKTKSVGYQHFALTRAHTNFMFEENEVEITPLPKTILTTGEIATTWLQSQTNIQRQIFKTACALRQGQTNPPWKSHRNRVDCRLLVALSTSLEEYVGLLSFLNTAFSVGSSFEVRIRPHPELFPLEAALTIVQLSEPQFFTESTGPLLEDLVWADMILYTSSTVAMEGISLGIPAINVDLGDFLSRDPMPDWNEFKWSVHDPAQLFETIRTIQDLPESEYRSRQAKGKEYATAYLQPVSDDLLRMFLDD